MEHKNSVNYSQKLTKKGAHPGYSAQVEFVEDGVTLLRMSAECYGYTTFPTQHWDEFRRAVRAAAIDVGIASEKIEKVLSSAAESPGTGWWAASADSLRSPDVGAL